MRKVLAIVLALVMAFGCTAIAFAEDSATADIKCEYCKHYFTKTEYNEHIDECKAAHETSATTKEDATQYTNTCPYCGNDFSSEKSYNDHIVICSNQRNLFTVKETDEDGSTKEETKYYNNTFNVTLTDIVNTLFDVFKVNNDWITAVSAILTRIMDLIEKIGTSLVGKADVAGAIDDLEAKVAELPIVGDVLEYIHNLINTLKQKVKDFYAHDAETAAVAPVDTGSTSVGIAAFACVSVAAAAAYVCTKKKED